MNARKKSSMDWKVMVWEYRGLREGKKHSSQGQEQIQTFGKEKSTFDKLEQKEENSCERQL